MNNINCQNSILFTKPFKKMPRELIFEHDIMIYADDVLERNPRAGVLGIGYRMADTRTGKYVGEMKAVPGVCNWKTFYPITDPYATFYIHNLQTTIQRQGYGKKFIELAKSESKLYGCKGRISLVACRIFDPQNPPHIFYRKMGFTSQNEKMNKYLDHCIKHNKKMHWTMADNLDMYLPIEENVKKSVSKIGKLFQKIKKIF